MIHLVAGDIALAYFEDMRMIVNVLPEAERMLGELARNGKPAHKMAVELIGEKLKETRPLPLIEEDGDFDQVFTVRDYIDQSKS